MKLNRKIIIPATTLLIGVALAGSASSTIAWYQYSTRSNVAYVGTSAGTSGNLQVRIAKANIAAGEGWKTNIEVADVDSYFSDLQVNHQIVPVTQGALDKDTALKSKFYLNPIAGFGPLADWKEASAINYIVLPLQLRFVNRTSENDGSVVSANAAKDVYLSDLTIQDDTANGRRDLSSAIRVHFSAYQGDDVAHAVNHLVSKDGGETLTKSRLNLDSEQGDDFEYADTYNFHGDAEKNYIMYGDEGQNSTGKQTSYSAAEMEVASNKANLTIDENSVKIGSTVAAEDSWLNVVVTIWVEGWHKLPINNDQDTNLSAIWSAGFIGSIFDVGMQFAVQAE